MFTNEGGGKNYYSIKLNIDRLINSIYPRTKIINCFLFLDFYVNLVMSANICDCLHQGVIDYKAWRCSEA